MSAKLYQHPSAPVIFDPYPQTPEAIAAVKAQAEEARYTPPTEADWIRLERHEAIRRLAQECGGYQRLITIARNLAHFDGQEAS